MVKRWAVCGLACLSLSGWLTGAQGALPGRPVPSEPDSGSVVEDLSVYFDYNGNNALWHQIYLQRNGGLFKTVWSKAYEEPSGNSYGWFDTEDIVGPNGYLPAGNYKWWVQGWNSSGYGPWSTNVMTFSVPAIVPGAPTPLLPAGTNTVFDQFIYRSTNTMVTWCNIYVTRNNVLYKDFWDWTWNRNTDRSIWVSEGEDVPGPDPRWPAGNYKWWVREWSPVGGMGRWSTNAMTFTIESAAIPNAATNLTVDVSDFYSSTRPHFSWEAPKPDASLEQSASATWVYYWFNRNGTTYMRGISMTGLEPSASGSMTQFDAGMMDSDLPAGRYDWWIQLINSKGSTAFIKGPSFTNSPAVPAPAVLTNVQTDVCSADMTWELQKGVYWYQVWVNRNGKAYATKWCSFISEGGYIYDDADEWNEHIDVGDVDSKTLEVDLSLRSLEAGNYSVWIKTYTSAGSKWSAAASFVIADKDASDPVDNVWTNGTVLVPETTTQDDGPHLLSTSDTEDWFQIEMEAGVTYNFATAGSDNWYDFGYRLYNGEGERVHDGWLNPEWDAASFDCFETQLYYLQVKDYSAGRDWSDPITSYTLRYWHD